MDKATKRIRKMRRQGSPGTHGAPSGRPRRSPEHYVIALDHSHLRVYRETQDTLQATTALRAIEAMDFPAGRRSATKGVTDRAGRFPQVRGRHPGMSIDERLPMQRELERRQARDIAAQIESFLAARPRSTWDLAASPTLNRAVTGQLPVSLRQRMRRSVAKDLVNHPLAELQRRFMNGRQQFFPSDFSRPIPTRKSRRTARA